MIGPSGSRVWQNFSTDRTISSSIPRMAAVCCREHRRSATSLSTPALAAVEEAAMRKFLTRLWINERGLAAIEFAFVLPIILSMFLGLVELSQALGVRADVINMTSAGADLVAQEAAASGSDLDTGFCALPSILVPHTTTPS